MRLLTGLVLLLILAMTPSCKFFKGKKLFRKKADTMAVWQVKQDSIRVADSIKAVQEALLAKENARLDSLRVIEEKNAWENKYKYNIIVGAFITPEYAIAHSDEYRQRGYETRIIKVEGSRFELVSAEAHDSFRKAVSRLQQFQDTVEIDAWMYIKK
jgi:hypothetical protein